MGRFNFSVLFAFSFLVIHSNNAVQANPTVPIFEAMGAWDKNSGKPQLYGRSGKGVGIAVIEGPNFNVDHPALKGANITLIDLKNANSPNRGGSGKKLGHANHVLALIAGQPSNHEEAVDLSNLITIRRDNPDLANFYSQNDIPVPDFKYFGGLAPKAKIYAYPRTLEDDKGFDLEHFFNILTDIKNKSDIHLINLSCKIEVNDKIIKLMNEIAESGKIFVQAAGNDSSINVEPVDYRNGSKPSGFSETFKKHLVRVGALSCYPVASNKGLNTKVKIWTSKNGEGGSSYFTGENTQGTFIFAPGSCVLSASHHDDYGIQSGTSMAAALVTGALAGALEENISQDKIQLLGRLRSNTRSLTVNENENESSSFKWLNLKSLWGSPTL